MDTCTHTLQTLFLQLGLPDDEASIRAFIELNRPLPRSTKLHQAAFWTESQAAFLAKAITDDSDWCALVDELDSYFREHYSWICEYKANNKTKL